MYLHIKGLEAPSLPASKNADFRGQTDSPGTLGQLSVSAGMGRREFMHSEGLFAFLILTQRQKYFSSCGKNCPEITSQLISFELTLHNRGLTALPPLQTYFPKY